MSIFAEKQLNQGADYAEKLREKLFNERDMVYNGYIAQVVR